MRKGYIVSDTFDFIDSQDAGAITCFKSLDDAAKFWMANGDYEYRASALYDNTKIGIIDLNLLASRGCTIRETMEDCSWYDTQIPALEIEGKIPGEAFELLGWGGIVMHSTQWEDSGVSYQVYRDRNGDYFVEETALEDLSVAQGNRPIVGDVVFMAPEEFERSRGFDVEAPVESQPSRRKRRGNFPGM
jgi:hypothetical protein